MSEPGFIGDAQLRRLAETTFDRNVVVAAGAGTGKTTLLVNRFVHVLMREPEPAAVTHVVALTFTNKAATEMKVRLRERLQALTQPDSREGDSGRVRAAALRERYGLSNETIAGRAAAALRDLEKAQIGTLHSFAAHVLRLYPIESGVDPSFQEDEGLRFEEHFSEHWDLWLDRELGADGSQHARWRAVLHDIELESVREVARALCSELVPLEELTQQVEVEALPPALREWFEAACDRASALLAAHPRDKPRNLEKALGASCWVFRVLGEQGISALASAAERVVEDLDKEPGSGVQGWDEADFAEAKRLIRIARQARSVDQAFWRTLLALLMPFVVRVRVTFVRQGWISFDGLLAGARTLLRDHPAIRERLKLQYEAILVDEFQDTDPVQYEIVLFLAERRGRCAGSWRDVELEPGKLFIVGDPKQSIYAFRRADIEAFERVVDKIGAADGVVYDLVTNFRSHKQVLEVVNAVFDRLLQPQPHLQPPNVRLAVRPDRQGGLERSGVELRLVTGVGEEGLDADTARRIEAEQLAVWLKEELLAGQHLTDEKGRTTPLKPGHIALLFRKLTQAQDYLDALRRHGIEYVTDGEKHFYRRQEVIDLVNVLRVIENPHDGVALLGVLRSPLGGVTDREIYELRGRGAFDYRASNRLDGWVSPRVQIIQRLYERLADLARVTAGLPLSDVVDLVFTRLPVIELAAASLHGEQAVANLWKVRQLAADMADRPHLTLAGFVALMIARLEEQPEESEGALAEESLDAVRVLTIHKAKGLEFPVVIVPGIHQGERGGSRDPVVSHDWSSGVLGLAIGEKRNLGGVLVGDKTRAREEAERRRLFYVVMTRAKEYLVLSGALVERHAPGALLSLLEAALDVEPGQPGQKTVPLGTVALSQTVIPARDRPPRAKRSGGGELRLAEGIPDLLQRWQERDRAWSAARATRRRLTPTLLTELERGRTAPNTDKVEGAEWARLIGSLAHRILEHWDFSADPALVKEHVEAICGAEIPPGLWQAAEHIRAELGAMFMTFTASGPYAELRRATILGREIPFAIPWTQAETGHPSLVTRHCVMEGVIDVVYRLDGQVWIADYKTDRVREEDIPDRLAQYGQQARIYTEAVSKCLGLDRVGFKLIFLRHGIAAQA